ncbi:MAG: sugar transferase [Gemmatimonadetes bacterium]|nr:sugar transferase [Gemmatimonadota bacterium]
MNVSVARERAPLEAKQAGLAVGHTPPRGHGRGQTIRRLQRGLDVVISVLALIALMPIMILIGLAVRLDSRGPVLYRQLRIGLDRRDDADADRYRSRRTADLGGRPFTLLKFRTMSVDAERDTGPVWASPDDQRVTRVGSVLRRVRLDELPQFWNVLKGDMAIVGPRPERPTFVRMLREELDGYGRRHRVRPGITGLAQVSQEPDQSIDDVRSKLEYDLEYLDRRSISLDLRIMLRTVPVMLERIKNRR